ncbi:MAG: response regulator [Proteobacteria bacterium]|nr:response regulator [Desulfobacula sp.]MBU3950668.1 response regulator [Pseudomonadota bacterium]MBU4130372.1 response regulator [Pseudomonadota bacterium]
MKILVIDDEKPTLSMFKLFLTAYGYEVHTAENGEKGLAIFKEIQPEIVFTDIRMPGMDGLEVLRQIRASNQRSQVIIITGHGDMEKAMAALDLDASDFINKPVERKALNSALTRAEKRNRMPRDLCFELTPVQAADCLEIYVQGKLAVSGKSAFEALSGFEAKSPITRAIFLFDESFAIDREGISLLMAGVQQLKEKGIQVFMKGLSYNYYRFFQMAGMDKMAVIEAELPGEFGDALP